MTADVIMAESGMLWWYVARAGGIVSLILAGLAVIWGLLLSSKFAGDRPTPAWLLSTHKFIGALTVTFTGIHVAGLVFDDFVHFGWKEVLIPFASTWQPGAVALGIVASYLLLAVQMSSLFMKRIPRRLWRAVHMSSYALFSLGLAHGVTAGTDVSNPLYVGATVFTTVTIMFLTIFRILTGHRVRAGGTVNVHSPRPATS